MEILVGALLALSVGAFSTALGLDRDRGFYPVVMIVISSYYSLFAIIGGGSALVPDLLTAAPFVLLAVVGFRRNLWLVGGALAAHGILDLFHQQLVDNAGTPRWWPMFCLSYDVLAAAYLSARLMRGEPAALRARC